jgi:hypothetical protein
MASWLDQLNTIMFSDEENLDDLVKKSTQAKTHDVGLINSASGAGILARDTGVLEGYAYYHLGFRMDPNKMMFSLFAPNIQFVTNNFQVVDASEVGEYDPVSEDYQAVLDMIGGDVNAKV